MAGATTIARRSSLSAGREGDRVRVTLEDNGPGVGDGAAGARRHRAPQHPRPAAAPVWIRRLGATRRRACTERFARHASRDSHSVQGDAAMKVLIVDDEPVARRGLRRQIAQLAGVTCVGECGGHDEAVAAIRDLSTRPGAARHTPRADERLRDRRGDRARRDAAGGVRDGVRPPRGRGVRGARARLRPQAGRSRTIARSDRARGVDAVVPARCVVG